MHEEEFQIIAPCAGSAHCRGLMLKYAVAVIAGLMALTLLLVAGMERFGHRLEHAQRTLTLVSAAILAADGGSASSPAVSESRRGRDAVA